MSLTKPERRQRIRFRIRKTISGSATKPRLSVFRSNKEIYAQLIDDVNGVTLLAASSREKEIGKGTNIEVATAKAEQSMIFPDKNLKEITPMIAEIKCPPTKFLGWERGEFTAP